MGRGVSSEERWAHLTGPLREELSGAVASSPTQPSQPGFWAVGFMALHKPVTHPQLGVACGLEGLSEDCMSSSDLGWFPLCFTVSAWIVCLSFLSQGVLRKIWQNAAALVLHWIDVQISWVCCPFCALCHIPEWLWSVLVGFALDEM